MTPAPEPAAIKLHVGLDQAGHLPSFVSVTDGKTGDVTVARTWTFEAGSVVVADRAYLDFAWFHQLQARGVTFVTRLKRGVRYRVTHEHDVRAGTGILSDQTIELTSARSRKVYPHRLRRVVYRDQLTTNRYVFVTNNTTWVAKTIADLYKSRWQIELFFKMIAMRDLTGEQRTRYRAWAMGVFSAAAQGEDNPVTRSREGLRFNPTAIAFAGIAYAMADGAAREEAAALLALVRRPAAAHGFTAAASAVRAANDRLPRAIVRCAFRASIHATRHWDERDEDRAARVQQHRRAVDAAIEAELAWLYDGGAEPPWPALPGVRLRTRRSIRLPGRRHDRRAADAPDRDAQIDRFDSQAAGVWLRGADAVRDRAWLPAALRACANWTWAANGAGLDSSEDLSYQPHQWNDVYLDLLAHDLAGADDAAIDRRALEPLASLPDESFLDALTRFQRSVDVVHFNDHRLDTATAVRIRARLAERVRASNSWRWMVRRRSSGVEMHLGPAIATLFLNDYGWMQPPKAYLPPALIERLTPFLPALERCAVEGATHFVAIVTLNLLEVAPRPAHLSFLLAAASGWLAAFPDLPDFWTGHGIGRRVCAIIDAVRQTEPTLLTSGQSLRSQVDRLLPELVRLGVADAARLEQALQPDASRPS